MKAPIPSQWRPSIRYSVALVGLSSITLCFLWTVWFSWAQAVELSVRSSSILSSIMQRSEIIIGVKTDFAPFGFLDASASPVGLEIDLARRVGAEFGVRVKLVPVTTENRFQRLQQGVVDIIIATVVDTRERRLLATAIEPSYYGAGVNVLLRPDAVAQNWQDLRGRSVCALQGAYFNREMTQRHILDLIMFRSVRDALFALRDGRCIGFLYTDVALNHYLSQPDYRLHRTLSESALVAPWGMSIAKSEKGTDFERRLSDIVAGWHREGFLIVLEQKWNVRPSRFVQDANRLWNLKEFSGEYTCRRDEAGGLPLECRNTAFITSSEVNGSQRIGLWLKENVNVNLPILYDAFDRRRYLYGLFQTVIISIGATTLALILGYLGASRILSGDPFSAGLFRFGMTVGRMIPPILQMYLLFFGLGSWINASLGVTLSPLMVAILALGAYHACIVASTLQEGARIIQRQDSDFRLCLRTSARLFPVCAVGIRTAINNLVKATTIAAAIAVPELLSATIAIVSDHGNPDVMMPLLLLVFYCYTAGFVAFWMRLEKLAIARGSA